MAEAAQQWLRRVPLAYPDLIVGPVWLRSSGKKAAFRSLHPWASPGLLYEVAEVHFDVSRATAAAEETIIQGSSRSQSGGSKPLHISCVLNSPSRR